MGVHCINPKSKDFLNTSKRLNISPANLEDIIHKYLYENDTDEYPSDDYIKSALEGTRTTMSQELADLWERYYLKPKRFKTLLELNRAKLTALKFFKKEAISEYVDADDNYVLKVAAPINKNYEKELQDILAKAPRDSQGKLLAPNGKPSNLTERQYALVRTKAFKDWFGDWENDPANASKVVDENGEPLVVYHGSNEYGFNIFDPSKSDDKISLFASSSKWIASTYTSFKPLENALVRKALLKGNAIDLIKNEDWKSLEKLINSIINFNLPRPIEGDYPLPYGNEKVLDEILSIRKELNKPNLTEEEHLSLLADLTKAEDEYYYSRNYTFKVKKTTFHDKTRIKISIDDSYNKEFFSSHYIEEGVIFRGSPKELIESLTFDTKVYDLFLNIKNPLILDDQVNEFGHANNWNGLYFSPAAKEVQNTDLWGNKMLGTHKQTKTRDVAEYAKKNNYDGVIFKQIADRGGYPGYKSLNPMTDADFLYEDMHIGEDSFNATNNLESDIFIAFNSNQIKSATDNTGAFSTTNDRIDRFGEGKKSDIINKLLDRITDGTNYYTQDDINYLHSRNLVINQIFTGNNIKEVLESFKSSIRKAIDKYILENHYDLGVATLRRLKLEGNLLDKDSYYNFIQLLQNNIIDKLLKSGKTIEIKPDSNFTAAMGARVNGNTISLVYNPRLLLMDNERLDYILAHELVHTVTSDAINNTINNTATKEEKDFSNNIWNIIVDLHNNKNFHWDFGFDLNSTQGRASHIKEFIANVMTNPELQRHLAQIKIDKKLSLWSRFINAIKSLLNKYLGINISDSYLEKLVNTISLHIEKSSLSLQNYGYDAMTEGEKAQSIKLQQQESTPKISTRQEMLNTMILEADGFIGEVSQSPYTKVGNKFVIKNNTEVEKAVNYISKRGVHKDRRSSLLSEESIKYLTEDKDNTSYYNIGYSSGEPYITAVTNRELFDENYTPKTIMFLRDLERLNEDIIKTQLESFKDTSTFLVDASDTKAIEFFDKNGYNYKVYQVGLQLPLTLWQLLLSTLPIVKKEEKRDPYRERQQEITRLLDALQESSLMTNIEIREIAEQVVYWISDHITELLQNPELAVKIYGDTVKNLNTQEASRIEIVNAIGLDNIKEMCKLKFSPKNAGYTKISTIRKANLIIDNWDAIMLLASDVFTDIEKFSITETVVADKVVSQTNENLNNNLDNFNAEELNDEESLLETHGNLLEHWQTKANTIDIMDSMSLLMHRAIAQCYQLEEVSRDENNKPVYDKVKSEFGINLRVKPREVTGSLLRWCQGCLNIKDVIANLKAKESANPWVSLIITKLEDNSGNESDFLSQFFGVFVKPFMSYSIVKVDENGNYVSQVVNKNPALKEAVKGITTLYKIGEHPMFKSNGAVNKETFKLFSLAMKELANLDLENNKDKIAHNLGFMYNALGFSITDDLVSQILDEDTYKMLTTQFGYIHKSLYDNLNIANPKDYEPLKFRGKGSFLGTLNKVLKPITDTLEDTAVSAFYDNGNMYQSYVIPSYMTKLMSKFHLDGDKFDLFITNEYGKYDWFKEHNSRDIERGWKLPILRELVTNPKAREVFDHKVLLTFNKHQYMKKMDDTEVTLAILAEYWAETTRSDKKSGRIPAWFRVPMLSNKPSAEYIKFYSERGINYQDVITDNVYKIFLQEMSRILTVMMRNYGKQDPEFIKNFDKNGKKFNFVDFMNEYLTGDSKNSLLGKLILYKLNGLKLNSLEELMFSDLAKLAIKEALTKKAESIVDNFERKGIFEGAKKIEGIDKDNIREELINFVWNDTYMSMNILQLTITDIAYYKDAEDLQKRLAQIHAPGIRANLYATDYQGNPVSDGKLRTIYLKDFDSFISNIVDNVSVVFDRKIKNAKTEEEKEGYRVLKESIVELFKNINVADAQGYSSPTSYRKKALLFGKWSKEAEDIYRKLISGEYTYSDLKTAFLPLKPFVYTLIEKSSNVNSDEAPMTNLKVGVLNKNSEYLLIMADALLLGEDTGKPNLLRALYSVMEESSIDVKETTLNNGKKQRVRTPRIDGLDTVLFESTVKAGLRGAIDINQFAYDEDGERKAKEYIESLIGKNGAYNETYVDEIPVEDYCLLQEIPAHFRGHELAHGSLIRAITPSDLESTDALGNPITYNVEGKELTAELFKTEYEKTIAANIEDSIEILTKELNLSPEATLIDRNRALEKILRREILSSPRYGVDLLLACTLNEDGLFRIPKGDPIQSKRIELLLNSIIKNRVNKQEIAGGPVVQVSNFGTSRELNIRFKAKDGGLLMTRKEFEKSPLAKKVTATSLTDKFNARYGKTSKTMTYELYIEENQAGIAYFEVFAPIYLNDIFEKFQNPDGSIDMKAIEELNPDLLKMIGYRIPTEDKYSCAPLKIVGFLPREAGDTIMLPNDITLLTGSDFK